MKFVKMHGAGNDYVFVNGFKEKVSRPDRLAKNISDRHFGVGSDGLILILRSRAADLRMRMFNADGSEAEMCGNGIRCVAKYAYERGMVRKRRMAIETKAGIIPVELSVRIGKVKKIRANLGRPRLERARIPMKGPSGKVIMEPLKTSRGEFCVTAVSMGNPHAVIYVDDVESFPVADVGSEIEHHEAFPNRTNVEFVQVLSPTKVMVRTWERGSGETLACGSGSAAVAVAGVLTGKTRRKIEVQLRSGVLEAEWKESDGCVYLAGPAVTVFEGEWPLRK